MAEHEGGEVAIRVRGARVHNLQNIDVDIPRDRLVVLTGVSGSGKSSLAFDAVYAEGQRRYVETLSTYARQFLDQLDRPDVDLIDGLPPTVAIDQKAGAANPRSTVATVTESYDYMRLLYARAGMPHCPTCGRAIRRQTAEQIISGVLAMREGRKVILLAPIVRGRKGLHAEVFASIAKAGLIRARVDGQYVDLQDGPPKLTRGKLHDIEAVVDRLVVREGIRPRLAEGVDLALKLGDGTIVISAQEGEAWDDLTLSTRYACPACGTGFEEIEPRTFSFNSPQGACPACQGLGTRPAFDPDLVIPNRSLSLATGAIAPWREVPGPKGRRRSARVDPLRGPDLVAFLAKLGVASRTPINAWPAGAIDRLLRGDPAPGFSGILDDLDRQLAAASDPSRVHLESFRTDAPCPECGGARLRPEARAVSLGGRAIHEATALTVAEAIPTFEALAFEPPLDRVGTPLVREVVGRLAFLERVGLGYLSLDRPADTLSGGELQRVRLATQVGSGLVGVCYVLDEPTAGLHPRDTERLLATLADLRDRGNSVIVVEHDEATIRAADWLIDLGPGAGPDGGRIVASGPPDALGPSPESATARRLADGSPSIPEPTGRLDRSPGVLAIRGASEHNLRRVDAEFPLGCLSCVTGVSGSGKSTLALDVFARAVRRHLDGTGPRPGAHDRIEGLAAIDKLIEITQAPIGRGPRSTPATATGLLDELRKVYVRTREAKVRGYKASRFSFNVKGGRCEACEGQGVRRVALQFLPDLFVRCEVCGGLRFNRQTLEARFKGKSIGEVLQMRVDDVRDLFDAIPKARRGLDALHEAGLGYLTLGQSSTTLSGGEAQRVKLAAELGRAATGRTLYLLDEPTTGLHFADVDNLARLLARLADLGNTVVVIEHNPDLIRVADWVVDLGPGAGPSGGQVVAMGPPAALARDPASVTGPYLATPAEGVATGVSSPATAPSP